MTRAPTSTNLLFAALACVCALTAAAQETQAPPTPQQRVANLKAWLQTSQAQIRKYEWIETTVIAKGGEEKSRKQNTCYYGVDGTLQKVPIADDAPPPSEPRGPLRKKIAANKKEDLTQYMQSAVALVHSYIPPDPARIQQAVDGGNFTVSPSSNRVRLTFRNYLKANDALDVDIEGPTNRLLGIGVSSYLDDPKDAIQLNVAMGVLPDGTIYNQKSTLSAPAQALTITIENSGYRPVGG